MRPLSKDKTYNSVTFDGDGRPPTRHSRAAPLAVTIPCRDARSVRPSPLNHDAVTFDTTDAQIVRPYTATSRFAPTDALIVLPYGVTSVFSTSKCNLGRGWSRGGVSKVICITLRHRSDPAALVALSWRTKWGGGMPWSVSHEVVTRLAVRLLRMWWSSRMCNAVKW